MLCVLLQQQLLLFWLLFRVFLYILFINIYPAISCSPLKCYVYLFSSKMYRMKVCGSFVLLGILYMEHELWTVTLHLKWKMMILEEFEILFCYTTYSNMSVGKHQEYLYSLMIPWIRLGVIKQECVSKNSVLVYFVWFNTNLSHCWRIIQKYIPLEYMRNKNFVSLWIKVDYKVGCISYTYWGYTTSEPSKLFLLIMCQTSNTLNPIYLLRL